MQNPTQPLVAAHLAVLYLAFARVSGIFLASPFYSGPGIPARMKAGLAFFLTACLAPALVGQGPAAHRRLATPIEATIAILSELAVGFAIGLAGAVALGAVKTAGRLVAQDMGLTMAGVLDPFQDLGASAVAELKLALALFVFLALDLHHGVLRLFSESFRWIPPGGLSGRLVSAPERVLGEVALAQGSILFEAAVRIALPIAVSLLLVTVATGILGRVLPGVNVLVAGFGARTLVGLGALFLVLPLLVRAFQALFEKAARESALLLEALGRS